MTTLISKITLTKNVFVNAITVTSLSFIFSTLVALVIKIATNPLILEGAF